MTELSITNQNIHLLEEKNENIKSITYKKSLTDNDNIFITAFVKNRTNFLNLENLFVSIIGSNCYSFDLEKYEKLYFLFKDDKIKKMDITNGYFSINKDNENIIMTLPYSPSIKIYPEVNIINFKYEGGLSLGLNDQYVRFNTIYDNLPITLKKINLIACHHALAKFLIIKVFDIKQKIPFGVELCLTIKGEGIIKDIKYELDKQLKVYHTSTIDEEVYKNKNIIFIKK
jgi:hypothetical protein